MYDKLNHQQLQILNLVKSIANKVSVISKRVENYDLRTLNQSGLYDLDAKLIDLVVILNTAQPFEISKDRLLDLANKEIDCNPLTDIEIESISKSLNELGVPIELEEAKTMSSENLANKMLTVRKQYFG